MLLGEVLRVTSTSLTLNILLGSYFFSEHSGVAMSTVVVIFIKY